jgi:hypothetical protein
MSKKICYDMEELKSANETIIRPKGGIMMD